MSSLARFIGTRAEWAHQRPRALDWAGSLGAHYNVRTDAPEAAFQIVQDGRRLSWDAGTVGGTPIVRIGERFYRDPGSTPFPLEHLTQHPVLWLGNASLVHFLGSDRFAARADSQHTERYFWDGEGLTQLATPVTDPGAARDALALLADPNPYFHLHGAMVLARRDWDERHALSIDALKALRLFGPYYLQHGLHTALGLERIPAAEASASLENRLLQLLDDLCRIRQVRHIRAEPGGMPPRDQRIFHAILSHLMAQAPESYSDAMLEEAIAKGNLFGIPVRVDGDVLVFQTDRALAMRELKSDRGGPGLPEYIDPMPPARSFVLDGLEKMARHRIGDAAEVLERLDRPAARHRLARARADDPAWHPVFHPADPPVVGVLRGGFNLGGAAQETALWLNRILTPMVFGAGGVVQVASGFYDPHMELNLPGDRKSLLPTIDRRTHWDSITRHLFDPTSEVGTDELRARYTAAVNTTAGDIVSWVMEHGIRILIVGQKTNPFEDPVALPALLGAKATVDRRRESPLTLVFRENYWRDPEGVMPRIPIWTDAATHLSLHADGILHLTESRSGQAIARDQYGIASEVLVNAVPFPDVSPLTTPDELSTMLRKKRDLIRGYLQRSYGVPTDAVVVLSPSRISKNKRIDRTLRLVRELEAELRRAEDNRTVHLLVLGKKERDPAAGSITTRWSGDEAETFAALETLSAELGLTSQVHYLGYVGHESDHRNPITVMDYMAAVDFVSQMSDEETFGRTYLEAIASGALVVISNFRYPGRDYSRSFEPYRDFFASFQHFVMYREEEADGRHGINSGMVRRLVRTLRDRQEADRITHANFFRAQRSLLNLAHTERYFASLLASAGY